MSTKLFRGDHIIPRFLARCTWDYSIWHESIQQLAFMLFSRPPCCISLKTALNKSQSTKCTLDMVVPDFTALVKKKMARCLQQANFIFGLIKYTPVSLAYSSNNVLKSYSASISFILGFILSI